MIDMDEVADFLMFFAFVKVDERITLECNFCSSNDYMFDDEFGGNITPRHLKVARAHIVKHHRGHAEDLKFTDEPSDKEVQTAIQSIVEGKKH